MRISTLAIASFVLLNSCSGTQKPDLELSAAQSAINSAQRAEKCAKQIFRAAQKVMAEANKLAEDGEHEKAREKALEAENLAQQALNASPPGCDQESEAVVETSPSPRSVNPDTTDAANNMDLGETLETIYFDYNQSHIREDSKAVLTKIAEIMSSSGEDNLEIEGHCDSRGSTEYNLHLGERRARAVRKYLVTQGVSPNRLQIISYGEERPIDLGETESAHQKNRRAELKQS